MRGKVSFEQLWQEIVEQNFPKQAKDNQALSLGDQKWYAEDKIDRMRSQKDEELEQYKKEIERAKRFESQKNNMGMGEKTVVKKRVVAAATGGEGGAVQKVKMVRRVKE